MLHDVGAGVEEVLLDLVDGAFCADAHDHLCDRGVLGDVFI
jgi:hypothetical protein